MSFSSIFSSSSVRLSPENYRESKITGSSLSDFDHAMEAKKEGRSSIKKTPEAQSTGTSETESLSRVDAVNLSKKEEPEIMEVLRFLPDSLEEEKKEDHFSSHVSVEQKLDEDEEDEAAKKAREAKENDQELKITVFYSEAEKFAKDRLAKIGEEIQALWGDRSSSKSSQEILEKKRQELSKERLVLTKNLETLEKILSQSKGISETALENLKMFKNKFLDLHRLMVNEVVAPVSRVNSINSDPVPVSKSFNLQEARDNAVTLITGLISTLADRIEKQKTAFSIDRLNPLGLIFDHKDSKPIQELVKKYNSLVVALARLRGANSQGDLDRVFGALVDSPDVRKSHTGFKALFGMESKTHETILNYLKHSNASERNAGL